MFSRVTKYKSNQGRASASISAQNSSGSPRDAIIPKATRLITSMVILGILCLALLILAAPYLGFHLLTVTSSSMGTALPAGSIAVVQPVDSRDVEVGDIIAFSPEKERGAIMVTHRVIDVLDLDNVFTFQTKGDNNKEPDRNAVTSATLIGRVKFHIPLAGYILHFIKQPLGYGLLICLPAIVIILVELKNIREQIHSAKRKGQLVLNKDWPQICRGPKS